MDRDREIHEALGLGDAGEAVAASAEVCVEACVHASERMNGAARSALKALAGVAAVTAERARMSEPVELVAALSLCARMIESASADLDRLSEEPEGLAAAEAAHRCAETCRRALVVLYETS
jgi:hypothetical protein